MGFRSVLGGLALTALTVGAAGCGDQKTNFSGTATIDDGQRIHVIGRIIDGQTRQPIAGAVVNICGLGSGTSGPDGGVSFEFHRGNFDDNADSSTTDFGYKVTASGYAVFLDSADFGNDETGNEDGGEVDPGGRTTNVIDLDEIALNRGVTMRVLVTVNGVPAKPGIAVTLFDEGEGGTCTDEQPTVTDAAGVATFTLVDPGQGPFGPGSRDNNTVSLFVPPQDTDGDGGYDIVGDSTSFTFAQAGAFFAFNVDTTVYFQGSTAITAVNTKEFGEDRAFFGLDFGPIEDTSSVALGTDFADDDLFSRNTTPYRDQEHGLDINKEFVFSSPSHAQAVTSADGTIRVTFQTPVDVFATGSSSEPFFTVQPNMLSPTSTAFDVLTHITATATAVGPVVTADSRFLVWEFKPNTPIGFYEGFSVEMFVRSRINPENFALQTVSDLIHIPVFGTTGSVAALVPSLDNYNGSRDNPTNTAQVFLEFNRIVGGHYRVLQITTDGVAGSEFPQSSFRRIHDVYNDDFFSSDTSSGDGNSVVFVTSTAPSSGTTKELGVATGYRFRISLNDNFGSSIFLGDSVAPSTNQVRLVLAVEDIEGNRLDTITTLDVK